MNHEKKILLTICYWVACGLLQPILSQNLVPNPSFEDHNGIPDNYAQFYYVNTWFGPYEEWYHPAWGGARPSYFSYEDGTNELAPLFQWIGISVRPHIGRAFAGIYTFSADTLRRDYICVPLVTDLAIGTEYELSFWLRNDTLKFGQIPVIDEHPGGRGFGTNNIGAYLSVVQPTYPNSLTIIDVEPQAEITAITYQQEWTQFRFNFVATEAYRFLTIGNFRSDEETSYSNFSQDPYAPPFRAYYYIDDVMLCPALRASADTTVCVGSSVDLSAKGCGNFKWHVIGQEDSILSYTDHLHIEATHTTQYIVSDSLQTDTVTVFVQQIPSIELDKDSLICEGDTIRIVAHCQGISDYLWNNGSTDSTLLVSEKGSYVLMVSNACGTFSDTMEVQIPPPLPSHFLSNDTILCNNASPLVLTANTTDAFYWQDGSTLPHYAAAETGSYTLTRYNACESQTDTIHLTYLPCGDDCQVVFPTAFSPNGDGNNDFFLAHSRCLLPAFSLQIYNRYGQQLFTTNDANFVWDGTHHGIPCEIGSYVWQLSYSDWSPTAVTQQQKGWVMLVR